MSSRLVLPLALDPSSTGRAVLSPPAAPAISGVTDFSACVDPDPVFGTWTPEARVNFTNPGGLSSIDVQWIQDGVTLAVEHPAPTAVNQTHVFADQPAGSPTTDVQAKVTFHNAAGASPTSMSSITTLTSPC